MSLYELLASNAFEPESSNADAEDITTNSLQEVHLPIRSHQLTETQHVPRNLHLLSSSPVPEEIIDDLPPPPTEEQFVSIQADISDVN